MTLGVMEISSSSLLLESYLILYPRDIGSIIVCENDLGKQTEDLQTNKGQISGS